MLNESECLWVQEESRSAVSVCVCLKGDYRVLSHVTESFLLNAAVGFRHVNTGSEERPSRSVTTVPICCRLVINARLQPLRRSDNVYKIPHV